MSARLAILLASSLLVLSGIVWLTYSDNQSHVLTLEGSILKVRTYQITPETTLVFADFRITNPTKTPFVVESLEMELDRPNEEPVTGGVMTRKEINTFFAYEKLAGHEFNEPLIIEDTVPGGETIDRMAAASFDVPENAVANRTNLKIRIHELDGAKGEIEEQRP